jgi:hypothetical protein
MPVAAQDIHDLLKAITEALQPKNDWIELAKAAFWPAIAAFGLFILRKPLSQFLIGLGDRISGFSVGAVSIQFAEARALSLRITGAVDLRHDGNSGDINDSTLHSFYDQIRDPSPLDYAVVDLGMGSEWLTSRLFILSVILSRMRGLRAFVFVETAGHVRRRFVGVCDSDAVHWRLASKFPWFEAALAHAEAAVWPQLPPDAADLPPGLAPTISSDRGRLVWMGDNPEPAAQLLRFFLDQIQRDPIGVPPDDQWQPLPNRVPPKVEHARWLAAADLEQIMGTSLRTSAVSEVELQRGDETTKARLLVGQPGRWVALTRDERVFDRLIDRAIIVETLANRYVTAPAG